MKLPQLIPMEGVKIGAHQVLDQAHVEANRGAMWWVRCPVGHQYFRRGTTLRQCIRDGKEPQCRECGG